MSNNSNNFPTLPNSNKSKAQKHASKSFTQISLSNNNNRSELQSITESELQELEPVLDSQELELESLKQLESYEEPKSQEEFESKLTEEFESKLTKKFEPKFEFQKTVMNKY
ncbi:hypothetical protein F8M41_006533 [Gigaspora margarita]|uniref:Uncharacterized protein n=1 Tax=Gigaspora margarita TaxID=4874 RepID=A0A8H4A607_GIGMA|nr:hypothetical protein F8M41_006533 [Gigaspora margarita]